MSFDPTPYSILDGLRNWGLVFGTIVVLVLSVMALTALVVSGRAGIKSLGRLLRDAVRDLFRMSWRRVAALTSLTFREALRRKALLVFVIFALLFMFAGWFLADANARDELQVKVYVSFVLRSISWLILPVVLLLACWGLPEDIRLRSLHTVVTKPARRSEIVLGRMLGVAAVGTLVLAVMSGVGYVWLVRNVPDDARDALTCRVPIYGQLRFLNRFGEPSQRGINTGDIWDFRSYIEGATRATAIYEFEGVRPERVGETLKLESRFESFRTHKGNMEGGLLARYFFVNPTRSTVGEVLYQSDPLQDVATALIAGQFNSVVEGLEDLAAGLEADAVVLRPRDVDSMEASFVEVSGIVSELAASQPDVEWLPQLQEACTGVVKAVTAARLDALPDALRQLAQVIDENVEGVEAVITDLRVPYRPFEVREYREGENVVEVPRELTIAETGETVDLFEDVAPDGRLRVEVRCLDAGQLIGMARPDLFLRTPDRDFWIGYAKAILGIWLMMLIVIVIGVAASCFLKGPVATLLTVVFLIIGQLFRGFLDRMLAGEVEGGGVFESAVRLAKHMNPTMEMTGGRSTTVLRGADRVMNETLDLAGSVIPDFGVFSRTTEFVANGFDVPWNSALLPCVATTLGYIIPCVLIGYFSLKTRELESK